MPLSEAAPETPTPKRKKGNTSLREDLIVSAFGLATSAAVAYGAHYTSVHNDFAPYTWMIDFILPVGAILCGFVAAAGYWIGARLFDHRPTKMLMLNIVVISLTTFFWIHQLDYKEARVRGVPLERYMSFSQYLVEVTEHMTYKSDRDGENDKPTELGKLGWGVAALQVIGFSLGGLIVFGILANVPYCDRCSKYLSEKKSEKGSWKEPAVMVGHYNEVAGIMQQGRLQDAIDRFSLLRETKRFGSKAFLEMELRKCPTCENRRLRFKATRMNGRHVVPVGEVILFTEAPLHIASPAAAPAHEEDEL